VDFIKEYNLETRICAVYMTTDFTFGHHASSRFLKLLIINLLTCY